MAHSEHPLLRQLTSNSEPYRDPLGRIDWSELDAAPYWLPPPALSLSGVPQFEELPEAVKARLSRYELIGVLRAGLWFEGLFMERLSYHLGRARDLPERAYLLHQIREEAGHSLMFLHLMEKSALILPALRQPSFGWAELLARSLPVGSTPFWLAVLIGEEASDRLNRYVRQQADCVSPVVKQMCTLHVIDEARHIAYARKALEARLGTMGALKRRSLSRLAGFLFRQAVEALYYPAADLYELAGLAPGSRWRSLARANPVRREFVAERLAPTMRLLQGYGFRVHLP